MSRKLSRRDFLKMTGVTSASLILSACGVRALELPTATSLPLTSTPFPTSTSTPSPVPTPTVEDLKTNGIVQKAIDKLVVEFNKKGIPVKKEEFLQNGLKVIRINGADENGIVKNYDVIITSASPSGEGEGYPVAMINSENNSIEKIDINVILGMIGIYYSLIAAWDEENKANWDEWLKEADIVVPDSASTQHGMDEYGLEFLESYFKRTRKNKQGYRMNTGFWDEGDVSKSIKGETDPVKVEAFMRERLATLIKLRPTEINVVQEPFDLIEGKFVWAKTPWYNAFGEDWTVKAFQFANEEAEKQGVNPGKDIKFYWNDWKLDQPSAKLDLTLTLIDKITLAGSHIDGVGLQIYNGTQNKYYPHVPNKAELTEVMRTLKEHVPHIYAEYETYRNSESSFNILPIATEIFEACKIINKEQPGTITSFGVWDNYDPASTLDSDSFVFYNKVTYEPNMNYYNLEKEMIRILA